MTDTRPERLHFTGNDDADRLLAEDPLALLIGFELDQQVPLQRAFSAPYELQNRIGTLDATRIAAMDPAELEAVFREKPALHRFPGRMAERTQDLCSVIASDYGGDASRVWTEASDAPDLEKRLLGLPGIGDTKAATIIAVLARRFGVQPSGWEERAPSHMSLGDVDSAEALESYQAKKRAYKASLKAKSTAG